MKSSKEYLLSQEIYWLPDVYSKIAKNHSQSKKIALGCLRQRVKRAIGPQSGPPESPTRAQIQRCLRQRNQRAIGPQSGPPESQRASLLQREYQDSLPSVGKRALSPFRALQS